MASLKRWALLALAGCIALTLAYVPPRGARATRGPQFFLGQSPEGTPARRRTQALAEEWREADGALRVLQQRLRLRELLPAGARRPFIQFTEPVPASPAGTRLVDSAMAAAWRELGLEETKIKVAVIVQLSRTGAAADQPLPEQEQTAYLMPDSTDRTTCIVFLPLGLYWTRAILGERPPRFDFDDLVQSFKAGFGPCGFLAAYGTPGRPVRQWLAARNWDVARNVGEIRGREGLSSLHWVSAQNAPWYWDALYAFSPTTVGCLAGRTAACRDAVLIGSTGTRSVPVPHVMRLDRRWWGRQLLLPGERFLGDVVREIGRDRFQVFWTSSLPVDTALAAALKRPVGEWTVDWERRFVPPPRLGPAVPLGAAGLALVIGALAIAAVARTASRRQVR